MIQIISSDLSGCGNDSIILPVCILVQTTDNLLKIWNIVL